MTQNPQSPYRPLGRQLKVLRDRLRETLAEASGAVEIDVRELASYELGQSRPSQEILLLLISHFGAKDDEAVKLWELAGYTSQPVAMSQSTTDKKSEKVPDDKIMFTDTVDIVVNNYGVVMNFMQGNGTVVARVGMSREHAKSVMQILKLTLAQTEMPLKLPNPSDSKRDPKQTN